MALAKPTIEKEKTNNKMSQDSVENCISKFLSYVLFKTYTVRTCIELPIGIALWYK